MNKTKLIVNLFGGPGCGKSTSAAYIFSILKMKGYDVEYSSEFAKDKVWEGNMDVFNCQFYVTGFQAWRVRRLWNKVEIIIVDSPIALGAVYADNKDLERCCITESNKYNECNFNVFMTRPKDFQKNGRKHTEDESKKLDKKIKTFLDYYNMEYIECQSDKNELDKLISIIEEKIK